MISFDNGGRLVEKVAELPDLTNAKRLFLDMETTAFDPPTKAINSWKGHRACGICVTADDVEGAWYVPVRHAEERWNLPEDAVKRWLKDHLSTCKDWVNHNVKFDAHFAAADGALFGGRLVDTLTLSKLIDSDRLYKGGYGLAALTKAWLEEDISQYDDDVKSFLRAYTLPHGKKAKDYGLIPADKLGRYGCQDVLSNRRLYDYILRRRPEEVAGVWETEIALTAVLFDVEREGMHVDVLELKKLELQAMTRLIKMEENLHEETGFPVEPGSNPGCFELLVNHFGLPVLSRTEKGDPSFDKDAMANYLTHPQVLEDEKLTHIVETVRKYRKLSTLMTFFLRPYQEHAVDGVMHSDYDQAKRTGRMGCRRPNAQQLSIEAKELVHPPKDDAFLSCDYSQIEFRLIAHYIKDVDIIRAYAEDPDMDFHIWIADEAGIKRDPAKNLNFAMGFGAGKRRTTEMLASDPTIMEEFKKDDGSGLSFKERCEKRAEEVYNIYHNTLPGLRPTTRGAARKIISRGFVFNAYGRRRHLPMKVAHIAFNSIIQSCAADVMKERTVALAPRYNSCVRDLGIRLAASVHDETLLVGERETMRDPAVVREIVETLEHTTVEFRVPIRTSAGWSDENWARASKDDMEISR